MISCAAIGKGFKFWKVVLVTSGIYFTASSTVMTYHLNFLQLFEDM